MKKYLGQKVECYIPSTAPLQYNVKIELWSNISNKELTTAKKKLLYISQEEPIQHQNDYNKTMPIIIKEHFSLQVTL